MSAAHIGARPSDAPTAADYAAHRARLAAIEAAYEADIASIKARIARCHKLLDNLGAPRTATQEMQHG